MKDNKMNKNMNWTSYNQQYRDLHRLADIQRLRKQNFMLEIVLAGLIGASVTLAGVIIHMMVIDQNWTW